MFLTLIILTFSYTATAQDTTLRPPARIVPKTTKQDTTKKNSKALDAKVEYKSKDSLRFEIDSKTVFLYKEADINYDKVNLKADEVLIRFNENTLEAQGALDSIGITEGNPVFDDGSQTFKSKSLKYNYKTQKGVIKGVVTEDDKGLIHGKTVKKYEDNNFNIQRGLFTTCTNEEHPHFAFSFSKSKVIPNDKIITGPANLVIEDVPTPLFLPFGLFPIKPGQRSGIIFPTYGESANRGFYLENGGYYWAISDYIDFQLTGDIYTRGSWALKPKMNYAKRYKYSGTVDLSYAVNKTGIGTSKQTSKDFEIRWSHSQDAKARPNSRFSANVNIVSRQLNKFNPTTEEDFLSNTFQSSISYQTKVAGKHQLTLNANHTQNTGTGMVNITLPQISFSVKRFYPFRKKARTGSLKWYENISVNYTLNARNTVNVHDSILFTPDVLKYLKNGIQHNIPVSSTLKILKHFNLTTSFNFKDRMYFSKSTQTLVTDTLENGDLDSYVDRDTLGGFNNVYDFSVNARLSTKFFGIVNFKKGLIRAVRHVVTPSVSFSYSPDFSEESWGYYDYRYTDAARTDSTLYSLYEGYIYGSPGRGKQGRLTFSISNNLEIKVRNRKDSINGVKKIPLIDNFTISGGYDFARDSLRWSQVTMNGRTRLFDKLNITYRSTWDPYIADSSNNARLNQTEWSINKRLLRLVNTNWTLGLDYSFSSKKKSGSNKGKVPVQRATILDDPLAREYQDFLYYPDRYMDWDRAWRVSLSYNLTYTTNHRYLDFVKEKNPTLVQTISARGEVSITPKWRVSFNTGYDFKSKQISYTSLNIYRDLHCWEMRFNWIPFGTRKSWNFTINVKSSVLQDLKLTKRKDFRDSF
ncbi:MAG: hypothetical protein CL663_07735 [Bacteroidetes bacterium]|nr:hypothetical protein [Bacteroidota bacterium]MBC35912.1 hypothetical protein [Bacteroidota bacterium]